MKVQVEVQVNLMRAVKMEIDVAEGDEPTDLTDDERDAAIETDIDMQRWEEGDCGAEIVGVVLL